MLKLHDWLNFSKQHTYLHEHLSKIPDMLNIINEITIMIGGYTNKFFKLQLVYKDLFAGIDKLYLNAHIKISVTHIH